MLKNFYIMTAMPYSACFNQLILSENEGIRGWSFPCSDL